MFRTRRPIAVALAGIALLLIAAGPALAAEPSPEIAHDSVVTVVFHDPEYDNGNGIEGAEIMLWVVDEATDLILEQYHGGTTDANGVATVTGVMRAIDPSLQLHLVADAIRDRISVDPDGCTVIEHLAGGGTAPAGLEVTIDAEIETLDVERSCEETPPPGPLVIVQGNAVDPKGQALEIVHAEAVVEFDEIVPITTAADGSFRVEVPAAADPEVSRLLEVTLIGPDVRTVENQEGCLITWTLVAHGSWTLTGEVAPQPTTLVAAEEALSGICGSATATPAPAAPGLTLPPTDAPGEGVAEGGDGLTAAMLLLLGLSLAATIAAMRGVSRRGS